MSLLALAMALPIAPPGAAADETVGEKEARDIAVDAYIYFYPLVTMDVTRRQSTNVEAGRMPGPAYFRHAAELMKVNPPHVTDQPIVARMKRIGLKVGESFDPEALDPAVRRALESAPAAGLAAMNRKLPTLARVVNGWELNTDTMGVYGTYYLKRAIVAMVGLGANLPEDAIYPLCIVDADGRPLDGGHKYVLHFSKQELPPVDAFWSLTMYDAEGFQAPNSLNRFAIGDRDKLAFNADGSLDLHIQHEDPGPDKTGNWLPAPRGPLGLTMRLYGPGAEALDGRWSPPAVKRVD